jgi:hypothetical protein
MSEEAFSVEGTIPALAGKIEQLNYEVEGSRSD